MRTGLDDRVREEILSNAFAYLTETGLEQVNVRELGKRLRGGSFSTLYTYFDDKDDCLVEATRYGLQMVSERLFSYAQKHFTELDVLFGGLLDEVDKWKPALRFIYQIAASPVYGVKIRAMDGDAVNAYAKEIQKMAAIAGSSAQAITPVIYNIIAVILGYVIWGNRPLAETQMQGLKIILKRQLGNG